MNLVVITGEFWARYSGRTALEVVHAPEEAFSARDWKLYELEKFRKDGISADSQDTDDKA